MDNVRSTAKADACGDVGARVVITKAETSGNRSWLIIGALFGIQMVNVADKLVVSLASGDLMREFGLSPEQYGIVASSFYSLYAVTGLAVGMFAAPRVRPRLILIVLLMVWSLAQLPVIFVGSFAMLIACRVILGMGEGPGTSTMINAVHEWFPAEKRNVPTAMVLLGTGVGSFVAAPVLSIVIEHYGWRMAFAACSVIGAIMLLLWLMVGRDGPFDGTAKALKAVSGEVRRSSVTKFQLWTDSSVYGSLLINFCSYWLVGFMVSWLAPFGTIGLGLSRVTTGWYLSGIYVLFSVLILGSGLLSDALLRRGRSSRSARVALNGWCLVASAACFGAAVFVHEPAFRLLLVGVGAVLPNVTFTLNPPFLSEIVPNEQRNGLMSLLIPASTVAGLISPLVTGRLIGASVANGWTFALAANGSVALAASIACFMLLHPKRSAQRFKALALISSHVDMAPSQPGL